MKNHYIPLISTIQSELILSFTTTVSSAGVHIVLPGKRSDFSSRLTKFDAPSASGSETVMCKVTLDITLHHQIKSCISGRWLRQDKWERNWSILAINEILSISYIENSESCFTVSIDLIGVLMSPSYCIIILVFNHLKTKLKIKNY